jgi:hypothetical protein
MSVMDPIDKEVVQDMFEKWAVTEGDRPALRAE